MQPGTGDYGSSPYYQFHPNPPPPNPNPNPNSNPPAAFASAPPYSHYSNPPPSDYPPSYPHYPHNPDPAAAVPSYAPPQAQAYNAPPQPQVQPVQPYNAPLPPPFLQEQPPLAAANAYPHLQPPPPQLPGAYQAYDAHQPAASSYVPPPSVNSAPNPYSLYESQYESVVHGAAAGFGGGYYNDSPGRFESSTTYGRSGSGFERRDSAPQYPRGNSYDDVFGDGVYAYDGGRSEPYGARGTASRRTSSSFSAFDDYGRSTSFPSSQKEQFGGLAKVVKAVPKVEAQQDAKSGVQKFRVKLLAESAGSSTMDVLCQIGLDGIRMLDPSTNRTLRIYPLDNVTRWDVIDSSVFAFWAKSPVDIEPRRIRLQSNSYTTNTILDIVTAATVQFKEMGGNDGFGRSRDAPDSSKSFEQPTEKKKGIADWMNFIKPVNEEKDHWVPDEVISKCTSCGADFGAFLRRHHCRNCGDIFCDKCTSGRIALTAEEQAQPVRVCDRCMAEVTQRLSRAKETASKSSALQTHEDLAKKLQEEMDKNRKSSTGSKSADGSGRRMREVACPTCTVHLQVQVPSSGSETIECGVCQHPFLVSAR